MPTQRKDERLQILRLLQEGKVTAEEAARLLEAVDHASKAAPSQRKQYLRVHVTEGGQTKVNVSIPLDLARFALRFIPKHVTVGSDDFDPDRIIELIQEGAEGKIAEIVDEDVRVDVFVE